jgi:FkbM family methyltransferase
MRRLIVSQLPAPVVSRLRAAKAALKSGHFIDETEVIALLAERWPDAGSVLVDVGAHHGVVTARFLQMGWSVVAYEPDPVNRAEFQKRIGSPASLQLSSAAVSDKPADSASLFTSPVSTGISSLSTFHESHTHTATVEVVTLAADLRARGVPRVDFLKVDIEGFDFYALKGFDWTYAPRFVLYEFEDRKTTALGYSLTDSSVDIAARGYHLVYSVWEPIVEYGTRHRWRGLYTTPPADITQCWGNVLCFREQADAEYCLENFGSRGQRWRGWTKRKDHTATW